MRPNFKQLAEGYRQKLRAAEDRINTLFFVNRKQKESIAEQEREITKLKVKYAEALNCLVELQEAIVMKENNNG